MNENYIQLGGVFLLAMSLVEIIKVLLSYMFKNNGQNNYNNVTEQLQTLGDNHLTHIYGELEKQTLQHEKTIQLLTEIAITLRERK